VEQIGIVLTTGCTVIPAVLAGFRQLTGSDNRKCQGPIVVREMQPGNHTRRHDWGVDIITNWPFTAHIQHSLNE
jgi:hypothetical protein